MTFADFDEALEASFKELNDETINVEVEVNSSYVDSSNTDNKKSKSMGDLDNKLTMQYVNNPTHENFNKLWERYYFGVKGYAYKFMRDWDLAADIACQTFTRAWEFKDMYDVTKAKFSTWLYTICRNLCLAEHNRIKKENCVSTDVSDMYDSAILNNSAAKSVNSTQYIVSGCNVIGNTADDITIMMYDTSLNEIAKLGGNYAKVLELKLVKNKKIREIAKELDMNESTVKNYLYKGKEELRDIMMKKHKGLYEMYIESSDAEATKCIM